MAAHSVVPTLPGTDYTSPEVYELERERIFCQGWLYAGRADRLPAPGSWRTVDLVGESILLVHGRADVAVPFQNAQALLSAARHAEILPVTHGTHLTVILRPEIVTKIADWLAVNLPGAAAQP